ncbi:sigma-70 family RNA polymerase sigma factor [Streptomyces sp. NPDC047928]|uniref:sigma-70 family RNA polymerase sigma factor n=1 Tax=unclassified Streptomyces TaxID=2593676 RepID=UPI003713FE43
MHRDSERVPELVSAARAGDGQARERLVADYLPLVYNIVGRALDGHADVDDVVQDTMFRALDNLGGLREPTRFRSWLIAIAMNQIRRRWSDRRQAATTSLERVVEREDPAGDFVELTILRLGLSGQRREVAEATRWLDETDRALLALWWQEAAGELSRAELADALDVPARHAAVRVQRMKSQLETGRVVVRALAAAPRCGELAALTGTWDGRPSPVWRKRIARHARGCRACSGHWSDLVPAEGLLVGLGLVVPLAGYPALSAPAPDTVPVALAAEPVSAPGPVTAADATGPADPVTAAGATGPADPTDPAALAEPGAAAPMAGGAGGPAWRVPAAIGGTLATGLLVALVWPWADGTQDRTPGAARPVAAPPTASSAPLVTRAPAPTASPTPRPSAPASSAPATAAPTATPRVEERLAELVNARRAAVGCAPLRDDARLGDAARAHARDMVARGYFDHASPEGRHADTRMSEAGYGTGAWAENLHRGPRDPAAVVADWMASPIHRDNLLGCQYRDGGVGAVPGPEGMVWVLNLASPA